MGWIAVSGISLVALAALLAVLFSRERRARARFRILGEVAAVSDAGGSLEETLDAICAILVPELADFCMVDLIADGEARRAAVRVADDRTEIEGGLWERRPSVPERMVEGGGGGSLSPLFFERMSDDDLRQLAHDPDDREFLREIGVRSAITVALNARGTVTGALTIGMAWSRRRYRPEDSRFAWILSGRIALALDNCGLFADLERAERARAEIGETLQHGLLPPPLPSIPGWSMAAMYRPAGAENEVGGDFYDVFRISGGWMLVIGDVTGRGARAASITAIARHTLRTAVALTADPKRALSALNHALLARGDSALCTLVAVTISEDPDQAPRLAVAGHPRPLLIDGAAVEEVGGADPVLGAFADADWTIARCPLEPGQQLVIVTDGVTDARGSGERFGEARLRAELGSVTHPSQAVQRLEGALQRFTSGKHDDDVAVLAIARSEASPVAETSVALGQLAAAGAGLDDVDG